ncbi:MAG TPA: 6,7-dimethyl-8-ribityllumazine synthase [Mycobacteriales bacterium]
MSGDGAPPADTIAADGLRVAVVASRWYGEVTDAMTDSAITTCADAGATADVFRVSGAFELPLVCAAVAPDYDAVVALGLVVRGGTPHFDYVCRAATDGLTRVALDTGTPVGFGVLTCDSLDQARDRAGLPHSTEDKGREAALAALETALLLRSLRA